VKNSKRDELRKVLFGAQHPVEKLKRIALGPLTLEGLPPGHYRALKEPEVEQLRRVLTARPKAKEKTVPQNSQKAPRTHASEKNRR
jgi:hypothetical protein